MPSQFDVAVVGVNDAVGEAILALLEERDFPVGNIFALAREGSAGDKIQFRAKYHTVTPLESFDFSQVQVAFFAASDETAAEYIPVAVAAGCVVIDNSAHFADQADVPLVVPEVNAGVLAGFSGPGIIASPSPITTLMLLALKPLHDAAVVQRINVVSYQAVSELGKQASEELASQTVALLNVQDVKREVFGQQIAFNVLGQIGQTENNGYTREEMKMMTGSQKVLADSDIVVNATATRVPVFFGNSAAIHLETREKLSIPEVRALLQASPGITIVDAESGAQETAGFPNAVEHAADSDSVFVGRIREDVSHPRGLDFWLVGDNIRRCAALNSVQIAEILVKDVP